MTDTPALTVTVLCLIICEKAQSQREDRAFTFWLAVAALTDIEGGVARPAAVLGVLPCKP